MKPRLFIGSSVEGLSIARAIEANLRHAVECVVWPNAFQLSQTSIDALVTTFESVDFGLFVLSPDDRVESRDEGHITARDNVTFEAGLFMGRHGLKRTFLIKPYDHKNFHMPTDLVGMTTADYDGARSKKDVQNSLSPAASQVLTAIQNVQANERKLDFNIFPRDEPNATWKLKVYINVKNNTSLAVCLRSCHMELSGELHLDAGFKIIKQGRLVPEFDAGKNANGQDTTADTVLINPNERAQIWLPLVPAEAGDVRRLLALSEFCSWHYQEHWLDSQGHTRIRTHKF